MNNENISTPLLVTLLTVCFIVLGLMFYDIVMYDSGFEENTVVEKYYRMGYIEFVIDENNTMVSTTHPEKLEVVIIIDGEKVRCPVDPILFQFVKVGDVFIDPVEEE